jgi:hypothetical protein
MYYEIQQWNDVTERFEAMWKTNARNEREALEDLKYYKSIATNYNTMRAVSVETRPFSNGNLETITRTIKEA